jgi:single-stranded-DNA-specific exonuclease
MKRWETVNKLKGKSEKVKTEELIDLLLENRGIQTPEEKATFLHPKLSDVTPQTVGIDLKQLQKTVDRILLAIEKKEQIIVFGDYDVDGITGTAILWETLYAMNATVAPFIPNRVDEGYGLSLKALQNPEFVAKNPKLIITVDNGIVATDAVAFANKSGIEVIITDHHTVSEKLPDAYAIVHTTKLCGAGVAYLLSQQLKVHSEKLKVSEDTHLELAALGTVADLVPLVGGNRAIVKHGLAKVCKTKRPGLQALYQQAGLEKDVFEAYDIGFVIGPRLNAAGRIESAMDSLRLLCTTNKERAKDLAEKLESINKERRLLLRSSVEHAILGLQSKDLSGKKIVIVIHEDYNEGVIGLIAGKLVEEFYRPAIVIAKREKQSKASVRSISGFNIIEFLRSHTDFFINVGGHPMAAGFTVETEKLVLLQETLEKSAETLVAEELLTRNLRIDCELPFTAISRNLYKEIQSLAPFGMGNPEPVFATHNVTIDNVRVMGKEGTHLRLYLRQSDAVFEAVAFGMGEMANDLHIDDTVSVAYVIDENTWNGKTKLQLKVKDIQLGK